MKIKLINGRQYIECNNQWIPIISDEKDFINYLEDTSNTFDFNSEQVLPKDGSVTEN
jgi:hypothetical protein